MLVLLSWFTDVTMESPGMSATSRRSGQVADLDIWAIKARLGSVSACQDLIMTQGRRLRAFTFLVGYVRILNITYCFSFVCAHLTPHQGKLQRRLADYKHIVGTLLFD